MARGVCWSNSASVTLSTCLNFTKDGTGDGSFTSNINELSPNSAYYVRAYATNSVGTSYGSPLYITTSEQLPTITTNFASSITSTSAISGGNISSDGNSTITASGVCWSSTVVNPFIDSNKTSDGSKMGNFSSSITGLIPNMTYYVRAYATNSAGTAYGIAITFKTNPQQLQIPTITTAATAAVSATTGSSGGHISSDGGASITAKGVCWSTSQNPTTANSKTTDGTGTGSFTSSITGLITGTTYYARAYATNSVGTAYGSQISITPNLSTSIPILTTSAASAIATTSATSGGNISSDGGASVTARGVCWSTSQNPTTANSKTTDGTGTGSFTSSITGLSVNTTYYVRAYATNSEGTAYGSNLFTTNTVQAQIQQ